MIVCIMPGGSPLDSRNSRKEQTQATVVVCVVFSHYPREIQKSAVTDRETVNQKQPYELLKAKPGVIMLSKAYRVREHNKTRRTIRRK